jgi:hypothetical protein
LEKVCIDITKQQQMHLRVIKKFNIFLGKLLHVSAPCGAILRELLAKINYCIKI